MCQSIHCDELEPLPRAETRLQAEKPADLLPPPSDHLRQIPENPIPVVRVNSIEKLLSGDLVRAEVEKLLSGTGYSPHSAVVIENYDGIDVVEGAVGFSTMMVSSRAPLIGRALHV